MGQPSIQEMSSDLASTIEDIGAPFGIAIFCLSLLLFLQGHRRLPLVSFVIGAAIGYYLSPQLTPLAADLGLSLSATQVTGIVCALIGVILASVVKISTKLLTSAFIFVTFSTATGDDLNKPGCNEMHHPSTALTGGDSAGDLPPTAR